MSSIEWTDATWNPVRGCSRVSSGCKNCYAERIAVRFSGPGQPCEGFADVPAGRRHSESGAATCGVRGHWTGRVELIPEKLDEPLRWRKPRRVFVNSMSDLFHEALPDEAK
jgi:protein gp37